MFQNYETVGGGTGVGPGFNGCDAVQSHMPNTLMTDPEILESFGIRDGSGGAGKWSGGNGAGDAASGTGEGNDCSHRVVPPFGVAGGAAGADKAVSLSDCSENGRTCLPIKPTS